MVQLTLYQEESQSCYKCHRTLVSVCSGCKEIPEFCKCDKYDAKQEKDDQVLKTDDFHPEFPYTR